MVQSITFNPSEVKSVIIKNKLENILTKCSRFQDNKKSGPIFQRATPKIGLPSEGLVNILTKAYSYHHKIILRPEDIWMAIQTQFCFYVNKYPEELRTKFVNHEGKEKLVVKEEDFGTKDIGKLSVHMTEKMQEFLKDPELIEWILPKFSTTTLQDTCTFAIISMGTLKNYFDYKFELCCGLPEVTLLGTVEDWQNIRDRCIILLKYDLADGFMSKWYNMLVPILDKFIETAKGFPDLEWWNKVCHKHSGGSGPSYLTGWVSVFTVFSNEGEWLGSKYSDSYQRIMGSEWPLINTNDIASCYTAFEVEVDNDGDEFKAMIYAGIYGADVINGDTLVPRIEWGICRELTDEEVVLKKAEIKRKKELEKKAEELAYTTRTEHALKEKAQRKLEEKKKVKDIINNLC